MNLEEKKVEVEWYDNPSTITNMLLELIILIIILSQSFAINNNMSSADILRSILNHNSVYLLVLVYFGLLKTKTGKKYFDFLNLFLILLYSIITITSLLTVFQSFTLNTILSLAINSLLILYFVHTFLRGTRIWKEFKLAKSPFNEITNSGYFYSIMVFSIILLAVNLISTTSFDGTVLSLLDCVYIILLSRYVYLYYSYLDSKKKNINNEGNFSQYKEIIKEKVDDIIVENKLDEKMEAAKEKVAEVTDDVKDKVLEVTDEVNDKLNSFVEENKLDEKMEAAKDKVAGVTDDVKDKVSEVTGEVVERVTSFVEEKKFDEKSDTAKDDLGEVVDEGQEKTLEVINNLRNEVDNDNLNKNKEVNNYNYHKGNKKHKKSKGKGGK